MQRTPGEHSGGQRQRVSLMRTLMLDPDLLLLGEPLGALGQMIRYQLQQELKAIFARLGKSVLTGIRLDDVSLVLQGAIPATALALLVQGLFELLEHSLLPRGAACTGREY